MIKTALKIIRVAVKSGFESLSRPASHELFKMAFWMCSLRFVISSSLKAKLLKHTMFGKTLHL